MNQARPAGDGGLLIDTDVPHRLAAAVTRARLPRIIDVVPGASTVLVITDPGAWEPGELAAAVAALPVTATDAGDRAVNEIPVIYDGPDLADVARHTGLSVAEVIARHQGADYTVGWLGFSPGFGYLTGLDQRLSGVPRLASPRLSVPAGSVAIAGGLAAVYPSASPGGWRLLGRTTARMWDPEREPPALLTPGRHVRFRAVPADTESQASAGSRADTESQASAGSRASTESGLDGGQIPVAGAGNNHGTGSLEVVRPGPLATIQDLGRPGLGSLGVPPSGAADVASLAAANRLAGNVDGAACIELTLGRAVFRCIGEVTLAATGAPALVTLDAGPGWRTQEIAFSTAFEVPDGGLVSIGAPKIGLRTYLAAAGGIAVPAVLGSRSADLLSGLGGGPLRPGDVLPTGAAQAAPLPPGDAPPAGAMQAGPAGMADAASDLRRVRLPVPGQPVRLRIIPGPRLDWFGAAALSTLRDSSYSVSAASNRTGLRLAGPAVPRSSEAELASEGMVTGSLQVPHDGQPILLLADHPTVGGYPVIAVLASADIGLAGQLRAGDKIRFTL